MPTGGFWGGVGEPPIGAVSRAVQRDLRGDRQARALVAAQASRILVRVSCRPQASSTCAVIWHIRLFAAAARAAANLAALLRSGRACWWCGPRPPHRRSSRPCCARLFGDRPITPGRVKLDIPRLAENGNIVPVTVTVDSPMTEQDYVKTHPPVRREQSAAASIWTSSWGRTTGAPVSRRAFAWQFPSRCTPIAVMSDDTLWSAAVDVEVTVGGCAP